MARRWYVVQTKSNYETIVVNNLLNQDFRCFFPRIRCVRKIRGVDVEVLNALFPSYVFVRFDIEKTLWRSLNGTKGVIKLLGSTEDSATPVPKGFVEDLLSKADRRGVMAEEKIDAVIKKFFPGDQVMVKIGIFQGFSGTCKAVRGECATVLLGLLQNKIGVRLPVSTLEIA